MKREYDSIRPIPPGDAAAALASGDAERIRDALLRLAHHSEDWRHVQDACLRFLQHPEPEVRRIAALSLGHLARLHGQLDAARVTQALSALASDPEVGGTAEDALDDIEQFVTTRP